jgi:hypothetical protein
VPRTARTPEAEEMVLDAFLQEPTTSIRTISRLYGISKSLVQRVVTVRKFHSVRFSFFADLAGVEGPWVPLMLGDAPSLLEHLESNLKSNEFSKLSLAVRLRVIACYRDRFVCVFSFPIPHPPVRLSLSLILSTLPFLLVFLVGFSSFSFRLAPAEEAAGIVPLSSQFQRDGSYIPSGLSGREPWPFARKISLFPIFFFLHGLEFIGVE